MSRCNKLYGHFSVSLSPTYNDNDEFKGIEFKQPDLFNGVTNVRLYYAYGSPVDVLDACYLLGRFNAENVYINSPKKNVNLIL